MKRRHLTKVAHLQPLQTHNEASPSSNSHAHSAGPYSPSVYSRADNHSEYNYQPYPDIEEEPLPPFPSHLLENLTSFEARDAARDSRISSTGQDSPENETTNRLSMMGPKMKMLSRAPWEVSDPLIEREQAPSIDYSVDGGSIFGRRSRSRTLTRATESSKGFGLGGSKSRGTTTYSLGSRNFSPPPNTTEDRVSILSSDPDPFAPRPRRPTWSPLPRARTTSSSASVSHTDSAISSFASSSSSNPPPVQSPVSDRFSGSQPPSPSAKSSKHSKSVNKRHDTSPSPTSMYEAAILSPFHPYANPELYASEDNSHATPQPSFTSQNQSRPLDATSFSQSVANPSLSTVSTVSGESYMLTPAQPSSSMPPLPSIPPIHASTPSSAVPFPSGHPLADSPGFTLISLDQAREKVRNRARSGDAVVGAKKFSFGTNKSTSSIDKLPNDAESGLDEDSPLSSDQPRTLRPKRSAFRRFFKEGKEKVHQEGHIPEVPPLPQGLKSRSRSLEPSADDRKPLEDDVPPLPRTIEGSAGLAPRPMTVRSGSQNDTPAASSTSSLERITRGLDLPAFTSKFRKSPQPDKKSRSTLEPAGGDGAGFQSLHLRPISSFLASGLPHDMLLPEVAESHTPVTQHGRPQLGLGIPEGAVVDSFEPRTATSHQSSFSGKSGMTLSGSASSMNSDNIGHPALVEARKAWRIQAFEYEAQIRELNAEIERLRARPCSECGAVPCVPCRPTDPQPPQSVLDRPRPKTGGSNYSSGWDSQIDVL
ncbi:uncharacterized protein EI90DRAFT_3043317 [Cantharellus anzutake]|uniref:uncharacterized protein n=1 Tax=Cantharellus anzutake TaxID=1750568 RepID=UPI0019047C8B|nr:uncharacterized protein EI90DRAFT_3043317 [Cantharellus anzutake]KAF8337539.1 hypothetical protein EI90DRAFT_3043317 [Cantharellus anzutake]